MIEVRNLTKKYFIDTPNEITALDNISLTINDGELIALVGASGSGKSTFMNIIGALDRPTSGEYILDGTPIQTFSPNDLSAVRNEKIGFVFQSFNLLARCNARKNIELPMLYGGIPVSRRHELSDELLELVEMTDRATHLPNELSGGQKQRVAIARALANDPSIVLADEPTGALDSRTGILVMDIFVRINREKRKTVIIITHSSELAAMTDRIITIADGAIITDKPNIPRAPGDSAIPHKAGE